MIKLADLQYRIFAASAHGGSWHRPSIGRVGNASITSEADQPAAVLTSDISKCRMLFRLERWDTLCTTPRDRTRRLSVPLSSNSLKSLQSMIPLRGAQKRRSTY